MMNRETTRGQHIIRNMHVIFGFILLSCPLKIKDLYAYPIGYNVKFKVRRWRRFWKIDQHQRHNTWSAPHKDVHSCHVWSMQFSGSLKKDICMYFPLAGSYVKILLNIKQIEITKIKWNDYNSLNFSILWHSVCREKWSLRSNGRLI